MTTKVPFTSRCGILSALFLLISVVISSKLIALQIVDADGHSGIAADELIAKERIPAQRGIIMDRNEEILTSNILSAEIVADRYHLREVTAVVDGLAYNQACNDDSWDTLDENDRRKLTLKKRAWILEEATRSITPEKKAQLRRNLENLDAKSNRLLEYDPNVCKHLYEQHDKLVAELLYPFLSRIEIVEEAPETTPAPEPQPQPKRGKAGRNAKKAQAAAPPVPQKRKRFMTKEDIIRLIAQPDVEEYNRKAEAEGRPTRSYRNQIILAKGLTLDEADKIKEAVREAHIHGIMVQSDLRRTYTMPKTLCHVLGYVNYENKGQGGVEDKFNSYLAGTDGMREYRRNARGQILPNEDDRYLAPKHGLNIKLTIDMRIQNILEEELDKGLRHFRAKRGCMIAVDPKTGDILGMVSRPSFDLNTKEIILPDGTHPRNSLKDEKGNYVTGDFNFACQGRYEPGSTMKVVAVTTALDTGAAGIDTPIDCTPYHVPGGSPITDRPFNYGVLTMGQVLKKSSNPGAARIALLRCKWPNYKRYLDRYGLTQSAGIALPSGGPCMIADGTKLINFSRIAYGYSLSVSPLHMAMVYATIANNGVRMRPRLIDKIIAPDGSIYDDCAPVQVETVMDPKTAATLRGALHTVTEASGPAGRGTATRAAIPGFKIGGKTGTAKKVTGRGGYHDNLYTVSFAAIFPIDNPRMVILTVVDEPHPTDCNPGGGTIAAPIFHDAAERIIDLLNIEPSDPVAYAKYKEDKLKEQATAKK